MNEGQELRELRNRIEPVDPDYRVGPPLRREPVTLGCASCPSDLTIEDYGPVCRQCRLWSRYGRKDRA